MYELTDKEFEAVSALNSIYKKAHFLQKLQSSEELYIILQEDNPYLIEDLDEDEEGNKSVILPIWCHEKYAQDFIDFNKLTNTKVQAISKNAWNDSWVKSLLDNKILVAYMPYQDTEFEVDDPINF